MVSLVPALVSLVLALVSLVLAVIPVAMAVARPMAMHVELVELVLNIPDAQAETDVDEGALLGNCLRVLICLLFVVQCHVVHTLLPPGLGCRR